MPLYDICTVYTYVRKIKISSTHNANNKFKSNKFHSLLFITLQIILNKQKIQQKHKLLKFFLYLFFLLHNSSFFFKFIRNVLEKLLLFFLRMRKTNES